MIYFYYGLFILFSWFSWVIIHEFSHLIAVKQFRIVKNWKLYAYPHIDNVGFHWARIVYSYYVPKLNNKEEFIVKMAPRIPNFFAACLLLLSSLLPNNISVYWIVFWGASLVDLFVGSLGIREHSDLIVAAKSLNINPWIIRSFGFSIITISLLVLFFVLY